MPISKPTSLQPRAAIAAALAALLLLVPSIGAAQTTGLPPAPQWKGGEARRGADGEIRRDPTVDPLVALTEGHKRIRTGSGFYVTREGSVVTNNHVISQCRLITIETPWNTAGLAVLMGSDPNHDLALLKTDVTAPAAVRFPTKSGLRPGERLTIIGYPVLTLPPLAPQITGAVHRGPVPNRSLVALNAAIAPGSSGGPALDSAGRLGGVITGEINTPAFYRETGRIVRDIAVAVPASATEQFVRSHGIAVSLLTDPTPLEPTALEDFAKQIVTRIGCWK